MTASSMFLLLRLRPSFLRRFSAALTMDAPILPRSTAFSTPRNPTPLVLRPQKLSSAPFLSVDRQRNPLRLYACSSEPPSPFLHPHLVPIGQIPKPKIVKDDCITAGYTATVPTPLNPETKEVSVPDLEQELLKEAATEAFLEAPSDGSHEISYKTVDLRGGRQRKRRMSVRKAPMRLYSEEEDSAFMQEALVEARKAAKKGEVPVGAVLVHKNKIIARFHNQVEMSNDPTAHAKMLCIRSAAAQLGGWRFTDVTMYVTSEPCPMCGGTILQGRVSELVWGAPNSLLGADGSWIKLFPVSSTSEQEPKGKDYLHPFHRTITVRRGVLAEESADIMQAFFALRRLQPKCVTTSDACLCGKLAPWPRSPGWVFPPAFQKLLNCWIRWWFQFRVFSYQLSN